MLPYPPVPLHPCPDNPKADFGEAKLSPLPFSRGLGDAGQFGLVPSGCPAQGGDLGAAEVLIRRTPVHGIADGLAPSTIICTQNLLCTSDRA